MNDVESVRSPEVFRGHLDECLAHLKHCLDVHFPCGLSGADKARQPIAKFCNIRTSTVKAWLERTRFAEGTQKLVLMCCLDLLGYRVIEFEKLGSKREFAELIGYRIISVEQAGQLLGYANSNSKDTYRFLQSKKPNTDKAERMLCACKEKRSELAQKKEEARQKCQLSFPLHDAVVQGKISAVTSIMEGLLLLLNSQEVGQSFANNLENLSSQERQMILRLSDLLREFAMKMATFSFRKEERDD